MYSSENFHWLNKLLDLVRSMSELGKPFRKKSDPKIEKIVNIKLKLPHVNKKSPAKRQIFVQTPFFHSTLKLEQTNFTPQKHSLFSSTSCFGVTKITTQFDFKKNENV